MSLTWLILLSCVSMVVKDSVGTFLTVAEARGNSRLASQLNPGGTLSNVAFFSVGGTGLTHGHGWLGLVGLLPVLVVDVIDGKFFTRVGDHIRSDANSDGADWRGIWNGSKTVARSWARRLTRGTR